MRVVLTTFDPSYDLEPVLALAAELRRGNHQVVMVFPRTFQDLIQRSGNEYVSAGTPLHPNLSSHFPVDGRPQSADQLRHWLESRVSLSSDSYNAFLNACRDADVLVGSPWHPACSMVRETLSIPFVAVHLSPFEEPALQATRELGAEIVNSYRQKQGFSPLQDPLGRDGDSRELALYAMSSHVVSRPLEWEEFRKIVGFFFVEEEEEDPQDASLVEWCSSGQPPILVALDETAPEKLATFIKVAVDAAQQAGHRVLVQSRCVDFEKTSLPPTAYLTFSTAHSWIFSKAALVVHQGGTTVSARTFRAGIPAVVVPETVDSRSWGELARTRNCVRNVLPFSQLTAPRLAAAIRGTLASSGVLSAAHALGRQIRSEHGVQTARQLIEELAARRRSRENSVRETRTSPAAESQSAPGRIPPLVRIERGADLPLSYAQQRLWFLYQLNTENAAYNMPASLHFLGALDESALSKSFNEIIRRHEVLRTTFPARQGKPAQEIAPHLELTIDRLDLSSLPEPERKSEARRLAKEEMLKPFDLGQGPLLRVKLLRLANQEHVLLVTMHHIVSDGWSVQILVRELSILYAAFKHGRPSSLPELPIQYVDYSAWQKNWLSGAVLEKEVDYWRNQLQGLAVLDLPADRPRPAKLANYGARLPVVIPAETTLRLKALAQSQAMTLFMVLAGALQTLLSKYAQLQDVAIGTAIANRKLPEIEQLLGFFVNTLVLRTRVFPFFTFTELLQQLKKTTLGAYAHQDLPFEKLVEVLQPKRDLDRASPFFR